VLRKKILTAGAGPFVRDGKQQWLRKHGLGNLPFNIVDKGSEKEIMAEQGVVLIDDKKENIDVFSKSGGIGILHIDTSSTIKKLQAILQ
jgi:hypothetical protein